MWRIALSGLVALVLTALAADQALARGGGGCLEEGTLVLTPQGPVPIERLAAGDEVFYPAASGGLARARVQALVEVHPAAYIELAFDGRTVRVTPEHPLAAAPQAGVFRLARAATPGEQFWQWDGAALRPAVLRSVRWIAADRPAYNLLVGPGGTFLAGGLLVHNKGCFLPDTPILRADGSEVAIRNVRPGDALMAYTPDGAVTTACVREVLSMDVEEYAEVTTATTTLRVTPEHPFFVGGGEFRTLAALGPGDCIYVYGPQGMRQEAIASIVRVAAPTRVYNLRTDEPHTFFASAVAVHNKGGGCFAAGTPVRTPQGEVAIEKLSPGDRVLAVDERGRTVTARVDLSYAARGRLLQLRTDRGVLRVTAEQPLAVGLGQFITAGELVTGRSSLLAWDGDRLAAAPLVRCDAAGDEEPVFNLQVSGPHTFIAGGLVVHNKGGGGFGGGGHSGGGLFHFGGSSSNQSVSESCFWSLVNAAAPIVIIVIIALIVSAFRKKSENLDYSYSPGQVQRKAAQTQQLLEFIAKQDATFNAEALKDVARKTFVLLQQCWQARDYGPMKPLLMASLYAEHLRQIESLVRVHEIDMIDDLAVEAVAIVNVRYTTEPSRREFTALISASAKDYYVDDRTQAFIRGDTEAEAFQEFWTFQWNDGAWRLREIEQTRESDVLKQRNFFEPFTDARTKDLYKGVGGEGPAGPWSEETIESKDTRIERLLNFLAQTDKLWDRETMRERVRSVFLEVYLAREAGDPTQVPAADLFPAVADSLRAEISRRQADGLAVSFRNLCVRKVDLALVRNFSDNTRDEFTARVSAHAQVICSRGDAVFSRQDDVMPFEAYWTFGRLDGQWKLKEVQPPARGRQLVGEENVDEGASADQLQWYYKQPRPGEPES